MLSNSHRVLCVGLVLTVVGCASAGTAPAPAAPTVAASAPSVLPPQPPTLPTPLVAALLQDKVGYRGEAPNLVVGRVPPGYPAKLIPDAPARIVGGMAGLSEVYAVFEDSTRRVAAIMEDLFVREGYVKPPARPGSGFSPGFSPGSSFCGDSGSAEITSLSGPQRHMARVRFQRGTRASCSGQFQVAESPPQVRLIIPPLKPPPGARVGVSGGGGGSTDVNSRVQLTRTELTPLAIVLHYGDQLRAAGWTGSEPAVSGESAVQFLTARDSSGAAWSGTLSVVRAGTGVSVDIGMRPSPRR
jgi:hypothetical protein